MKSLGLFILLTYLCSCSPSPSPQAKISSSEELAPIELIVLGTVQDAGSPQLACLKACCKNLSEEEKRERKVVSLGIIDRKNQNSYLLEATPDLVSQITAMQIEANNAKAIPDGIFISHAHMGHYSGLLYLGRESMNASKMPVYVMPRMKAFLENNGPWNQLVGLNNVALKSLRADSIIVLSQKLSIEPILVPHRDEFSETVGFKIKGPEKTVLFIPDIDKWNKWDRSLEEELKQVDLAFVDATFYDQKEIPMRNMNEIPHPFVMESMELLKGLSSTEKSKVYFIHFNHTNPLLLDSSKEYLNTVNQGFNVAKLNQKFKI